MHKEVGSNRFLKLSRKRPRLCQGGKALLHLFPKCFICRALFVLSTLFLLVRNLLEKTHINKKKIVVGPLEGKGGKPPELPWKWECWKLREREKSGEKERKGQEREGTQEKWDKWGQIVCPSFYLPIDTVIATWIVFLGSLRNSPTATWIVL